MSDPPLSVSEDDCGCDDVKQTRAIRQRKRKNDRKNDHKQDHKLSPQELFNKINRTIAEATKHQFLTYEGVDPKTGSLVADSLGSRQKSGAGGT